MAFAKDAIFTRSRLTKLSLSNRGKDYQRLVDRPELLALHRRMNELLLQSSREWTSYDYGEGYFYQGLDLIGVTGLRDTRARVEAMGLTELVRGRTVIEIGCNTGFLSLTLAPGAKRIVGFDINPFLIDIGRAAAEFLGQDNVELFTSSFEDLEIGGPFDVVISFANHSTYDGNTRQSIEDYLRRCDELLGSGGTLLFESHPPAIEGEGLAGVCALIGDRFDIRDQRVLDYGTFLDRDRTFIRADKRP